MVGWAREQRNYFMYYYLLSLCTANLRSKHKNDRPMDKYISVSWGFQVPSTYKNPYVVFNNVNNNNNINNINKNSRYPLPLFDPHGQPQYAECGPY